MLSIEETVNVVILMTRLDPPTLVERQLRKDGAQKLPTHQNMNSLYSKFKETGWVHDRQRSGRPSLEEDKVNAIQEYFETDPSLSIRKAAAIVNMPATSVQRVLHYKLGMKTSTAI